MLFLSVISFSSLLEFHSSMERVAGKQHHFFLKSVKKKFLLVENLMDFVANKRWQLYSTNNLCYH